MLTPRGKKEAAQLWLAIWIVICLASYRLLTEFVYPVRFFLEKRSDLPLADFLLNLLFFWLLGLLWLAYRRWRRSAICQRELERIFASISPDTLLVVDPDRRIRMCNRSVRLMFQYEPEEVLDRRTDMLYSDRRVTGTRHELYRHLERVGFHVGSAMGRRKNGVPFPIEIITAAIQDQTGVVILIRDVTDRQRAEDALRESKERFALFMRHLPACASLKDGQGQYVYANEGFTRVFGWKSEEMVGRTDEQVFGPLAPALKRGDADALAHDRIVRGEETLPVGGSERCFETLKFAVPRDPAPPLLGAIYTDVTDRRRAEKDQRELEIRMRQVQKLESLGALGGGVAHDFNNLLAGILGYADLALADLPAGSPAHASVSEVVAASKRASTICRQLLAYSGQVACSVDPLDLSALIRDIGDLAKASVAPNAKLALDLPDGLPAVVADAAQLRQVIVNLLLNASEALEGKAGRIEVATGQKWCGAADLRSTYLGETVREGNYVFLRVTDNGVGMDEATRVRMFDPFFSTKFRGRGLGLAAVIGIVRAHQGAIEVESQPGKGTMFVILLPASDRPAINREARPGGAREWVGQGTVLVVDDERFERVVASTMLERVGFSVLIAEDRDRAAEMVRTRKEIVAVLLDVTSPKLGGVEACHEIQKTAGRRIPVIFSSGFSKPASVAQLERENTVAFLRKPYETEELRETFRQVLSRVPPAPVPPAA